MAIGDNLNTYAAIFALWMEGKCYVPLHPAWPKDRIEDIKKQVGCTNVLDNCDAPYTEDLLDDWKEASEDDLAYILFTSGSTGTPKGVQLTRGNIAAFMDSFWKTGISIDETDRCMQVFDLTFDVSVQSYLVALTRGACCYTVPYGQVKYLYAAGLIQEQGITFGAMAPSMLTYLRPYFDEFDASSMKACILTAEACPADLMESWYQCAKNTEIYDFYGPTEATIYCTYYKLTRGGNNLSLNGIISIGKPMANVQAIIIDEEGNIIQEKSGAEYKGELCVAGPQLTPGYWKNEEKNASAFFEKQETRNGKQEVVRYYHTGDLCYWDESGNIMYSGRIDQQAKIQGFRVELGEIEYHAREFFNKERRVMAIAFQNDKNLTEIAMFIESAELDTKVLVEYMRSKMPTYMIPTRFIFLESFPLNKSEKVDRNALKQMI
ncbi:MAG: AMP-binding protein [Paludibacteraceae bacterium]|nr:AMP-binding protein [Paludibacteraceae bacterium]